MLPEEYPLCGQPAYRKKQIAEWLYKNRAETFDEMKNLPSAFKSELDASLSISLPKIIREQRSDETRLATFKWLWQMQDGALVESVLIPASPALYGETADRRTLCVSTQVGCAYGCHFCASGLGGWKRDLTAGEIVAQVLAAEKHSGEKIQNLVFMGMGEPLANFDALLRSLQIINAPWGIGIGARHLTVSTCGLAPKIKMLAESPLQIGLAISLHGATNEVRSQLMPINKKHPLEELVSACVFYQEKKGRLITFEFILIDGLNDTPEQASKLTEICRRVDAKINIIPCNPVEGLPWRKPPEDKIERFCETMQKRGLRVTLRKEKGGNIDAACGQLRLKEETNIKAFTI